MKIVFFNRSLMSGGIEKCIELLSSELYQEHEIEIVYSHEDKLDPHIVEILSKYGTVTKLENQTIKCDICIFCYLYFDYDVIMSHINAKSYFCWIHSQPRALDNCLLDNENFVRRVSKFICVSDEVKDSLNIPKEGIVIHNFINQNIKELASERNPFEKEEEKLKLVIVSRLSEGKGFERVVKLVESLEQGNIEYSLKIVGKGRKKEQEIKQWLEPYSKVEFEGYQDNPYCYIKNADYLVLLSDYECWGNVITEAKALGVPCLVTDFPSSKEQIIDGVNGIIVSRDLEDYNEVVRRLVTSKQMLKSNLSSFEYHNETEEWRRLIQRELER